MSGRAGPCNPWLGTLPGGGLPAAVVLLAAAVWAGVPAAADRARQVAYGQHLAQECTSCHRLDGTDNGIPSIVGWEAASFRQTLLFYRRGERTNPAMISVARSLDDEQMDALAAYYATLPKPRPGTNRVGKR